MSILEELWYGNINPSEDKEISDGEKKLVELMARHQEYLISKLKDKELDTYQKDDYSVFSVWKNDTGEEIALFQNILDTDLNINNEHNYQELTINGYDAYLNEYEYNSSLIWTDGVYWFTLNVPVNYIDKIITMAENISEKN